MSHTPCILLLLEMIHWLRLPPIHFFKNVLTAIDGFNFSSGSSANFFFFFFFLFIYLGAPLATSKLLLFFLGSKKSNI